MSNDIIKFKRGNLSQIPSLLQGEPYFAWDEEEVYIGGLSGAFPISGSQKITSVYINAKFPPFGLTKAVGDGVVNDTTALQSMIDYINTNGGGILILPIGTYLVDGLMRKSNVKILGVDLDNSIIKLVDNSLTHVFDGLNVSNSHLENFTINGNRVNQTLDVHGLRGNGDTDLFVNNMKIIECYGYGIGLQDGTFERIKIQNTILSNLGRDGIDIKNKNDNNKNIQINNVTILDFGLQGALTNQAGIDIRGEKSILSDINIDNVSSDNVGIRFRAGTISDVNGLGGHKSLLTNFIVNGNGIGVELNADDCIVSNGSVDGLQVLINGERNTLNNVCVKDSLTNGFFINDLAERTKLNNCKAINATTSGVRVEGTKWSLNYCDITDNLTEGIRIIAGATGGNISNCYFDSNVLNINGTEDYTAHDNIGYITQSNVASPDVPIDSVGIQSIGTLHGLSETPNIEDISVTLLENTVVDDYEIGFIKIAFANSTQIVCDVNIVSASATVGAVANLGIKTRLRV